MSGKGNSGSSSSGSSGSGNSLGHPYTVNSSGTNSQGNSYDNRSTPSGETYHYSNNARLQCANERYRRTDGSYYYSNGNGSTYHNTGSGSTYTAPDGSAYKK
ncbi:hypothetical protein SBOR_8788 [Sclerotinia borealis F-4128]|uniref:Uncharacterized protein n=1 Tax=Sclerotinia borealis (strain F-4128) TaxID=1432307 RepID=W9C224_SCLBF|nr:hypothetical protein SBOR_8788 [Sclerotinia borealis F-4128]